MDEWLNTPLPKREPGLSLSSNVRQTAPREESDTSQLQEGQLCSGASAGELWTRPGATQ